jgi:hypothetical protein
VAEADNKTTTSRYLTLPQAAARIGREELRCALEDERLLATDRVNRIHFEELANFLTEFGQRGVSRADLDAVRAISRGFAIPPQSWRRWFADGSVNLETGEVVRPFHDRLVIFRPVLLSADVPAQTTTDQTATKTPTVSWITAEAKRLKAAGKISELIHITDFAKLLEAQMRKAAKTDSSVRWVKWQYIKNELPGWGLWPISLIKG